MTLAKKKKAYAVSLRGGFLEIFGGALITDGDDQFTAVKSTQGDGAPEEGDRYFNSTSKSVREFANGAWRGLEADLLDGLHAQDIIDAIAANIGLKFAYGWMADAGKPRFDVGLIEGASGSYTGDNGGGVGVSLWNDTYSIMVAIRSMGQVSPTSVIYQCYYTNQQNDFFQGRITGNPDNWPLGGVYGQRMNWIAVGR